jgi:hypothetical protein
LFQTPGSDVCAFAGSPCGGRARMIEASTVQEFILLVVLPAFFSSSIAKFTLALLPRAAEYRHELLLQFDTHSINSLWG